MPHRQNLPDALSKPRAPTKHLPGTVGKVRVLARRARSGEFLWHPADAMPRDGIDPKHSVSIDTKNECSNNVSAFQDAEAFEDLLSDDDD